jgi:hypothetical protein
MNEENPTEVRTELQTTVEETIEEITTDEVANALKKMKIAKAAGPDNLPIEVWK